jgi:hypothetical protein
MAETTRVRGIPEPAEPCGFCRRDCRKGVLA